MVDIHHERPIVDPEPDRDLFDTLMSYYCHQNELMWSRVQTLLAIQAGVLGGGYSLASKPWIAAPLFAVGALLTIALLFMMRRDEQLRDVNQNLLTWLGHTLSEQYVGKQVPTESTDNAEERMVRAFRLRPPPSWPAPFRASHLNTTISLAFMVIDVALAVIALVTPQLLS